MFIQTLANKAIHIEMLLGENSHTIKQK